MEAQGMEGTVTADEVGITFHFKGLALSSEKRAASGILIPWTDVASVTFTRKGKYSPGYFRVNQRGDTAAPKPAKDPRCLTANVGAQADAMKLFADEISGRLGNRTGASPSAIASGHQRATTQEASSAMSVKLGARREVRKLKQHLLPGESVRYLASGTLDRKRGLLALTDQRLIMLFHGHLRQAQTDIPLDRITSVQDKTGVLMGRLTVASSNTQMIISDVAKTDLRNLTQALRLRMSQGSLPPLPPLDLDASDFTEESSESASSNGSDNLIGQLERLISMRDQGLLDDTQFETAKQRLLNDGV